MPFNGEIPSLKTVLKTVIDDLNRFLFVVFIIDFIVSLFTKSFIVDISTLLLFIIIIYRFFSKNKTRRYKENQLFLKCRKFLLKPFDNIIRNFKDRKYHVYKKCHKCKTILKLPLPSKRGIKHAKCPKCGKRLTIFTLRKEKIEIIKIKK